MPSTRARTSAVRYATTRPLASYVMGASPFCAMTTVTSDGGICGPPAPAWGPSLLPQAERIQTPATTSKRYRTVFNIKLHIQRKQQQPAYERRLADRFRCPLTRWD